jgi:hypothetical protein
MTLISSKQIKKDMEWVINDKRKGEIGFTFIRHIGDYSFYNREQMNEQMREWRKDVKAGKIVIDERNHRSPTICGKQFHTLVLQSADLDANPMNIDRIGLAFDDGCFLVSGYIYCFKTLANRDSVFKYVMTGKSS